ncbi:OLC1v1020149C1 [Oldenlandia corymbosa var. corymbosa]|uniref:OLC1v1020149C1 n=1 Tax=Oldenlandia corymbosa var. corymbosa TaxID=529605 RepID=A0AAV1EG60_OLDCO|nr:OLC1v1020149C1 [Oldenlandia corymbosa var. corymbosa]
MSFLAQKKRENPPLPSTSMSILKKQCESKQSCKENAVTKLSMISSQEISVVDIVRMATETMSQCISQNSDCVAYDSSFLLQSEKSKDLELVLSLQAAAISFSKQQFDQARNRLSFCQRCASPEGTPLQRLIYYFAEALQEGISAERGEVSLQEAPKESQKCPAFEKAFDILLAASSDFNDRMPFCPVSQFTAIQALLENVASARKIHVVDFGIKSGTQWPILMQALINRNNCPLEYLKITVVGSSKEMLEKIGNELSSFAASLKIPFAFKMVISDLKNLDKHFFELAADETLAVYSELRLATLLAWPHHLVSVLETIKKLRPKVIVTIEVDSNTNAPIFLDRFNASLSLSAVMFDSLEVCMKQNRKSREIIESVMLRQSIKYLITSKGEESMHRQESVGFWRTLFRKLGMFEIALSNCALYQATLTVKSNPRWGSCTVECNGKGMTVGWKGTPVHFLTVWKC